MNTELLETCRGFTKKNIIEEIVHRVVAGPPLTHSNYTISCINTIVLLKMSTQLLETCRGFK